MKLEEAGLAQLAILLAVVAEREANGEEAGAKMAERLKAGLAGREQPAWGM